MQLYFHLDFLFPAAFLVPFLLVVLFAFLAPPAVLAFFATLLLPLAFEADLFPLDAALGAFAFAIKGV